MWFVTLRGLAAHKLRLALAALSVVLGIAFVAGTLVLTDTISRSVEEVRGQLSAGSDVSIRSRAAEGTDAAAREPVPAAVVEKVRAVDGVAAAAGSSVGFAQVVDGSGQVVEGRTIGMAMPPEQLGYLHVRAGRAPAGPGEVALDLASAKDAGLGVGAQVTLQLAAGPRKATVVGLLKVGSSDGLPGAGIVALEPAAAATAFGRPGTFASVEVAAADGVPAEELRQRIAAVLPRGLEAVDGAKVGAESAADVGNALRFLPMALLAFAAISLFVGGFLIVNTFGILVRQRMREYGLLRAVGASRAQVVRAVLGEALVTGFIASALGFVVGVGAAHGLQSLLGAVGVDMPDTELAIQPRTAVVSLVVGTLLTVASAIVPALWAGRVPPIAAILGLSAASERVRRRRSIVAGAVTIAGLTLIAVGLRSDPESALRYVGGGALVAFVGVAGLARHVVRPLVAVARPVTAVLGVAGRIGRDNAARNPQRTASTAAALMIGLALVVFTSVFAASAKASLASAMDVGQRADYLVTSEEWTPFSPQLTATLAERPEFSTVAGLRSGAAGLGGKQIMLNAVEPRGLDQLLELDLEAGRLESSGVVVHRDVARANGWSVGQQLSLRFVRTGEQRLTITGIYAEKRLLGVDYLLPMAEYERNYVEQLDALALVRVAAGTSPEAVSAAFDSVLRDYPQLTPKTKDEVRAEQARQLDQALALVTAMLGLALLIAFLGIMNTLALTVYERTREIGLVRAIGMSRRQVRRSVRFEAVLVALIGAVLGVAVGVAGGGALVQVLRDKGLSVLAVPTGQLAVYVLLAAGAGVLAAAWPARRAARLDVLAAIAHD